MKISLREITKSYQLKTALEKVSVDFAGGKIHGLLGENGAGKSTLAKIICGLDFPTSGSMFLDEKNVSFSKPADALKKGIAIVNQRPLLANSLTAEENIVLATRKSNSFFIPPRTPQELSELKSRWAPNLPLKSLVKDLGGNNRFYVSLLTALLHHPDFLVLDEPSAFLDLDERRNLYNSLKQLAQTGTGIIVITHSTAEAKNYCDTVTVLKKGILEAVYQSPEEYSAHVVAISGETRAAPDAKTNFISTKDSPPCLALRNVSCRPKDRPALLEANIESSYGEITAVTGIKEAALDTLEDFITGISTGYAKGKIIFNLGDNMKTLSLPKQKLTSTFLRKNGCAIVPSDKTFRASNPRLTVQEMLGVYAPSREQQANAKRLIGLANVNINPDEKCSSLSGGMLQRLILERELSTDPRMIILCNPMHGLDIEAQSKLSMRIAKLVAEGKAVLIIGSIDFPMTLCSRVYSIEGGKTFLTFEKK